ncbi:uncharacterized protein MONBRDRAFT_39060 [Monosiga brevicollis MX1]|uniref:Uncharacterized protein n=1 Tax=Monosiga brevicollis TaxID=81824 RepID=A9VBZ2_MONBE|nr:uncharacterized protein MONBRDRAFT_39060 [Monosiga brevicollis MX1]EDQ84935.1 predicted protein [Monosiga brevicollis MX1]|eukprot:XP_001750276.1 hypothetical protein [Monosiga brevicollis MX1]
MADPDDPLANPRDRGANSQFYSRGLRRDPAAFVRQSNGLAPDAVATPRRLPSPVIVDDDDELPEGVFDLLDAYSQLPGPPEAGNRPAASQPSSQRPAQASSPAPDETATTPAPDAATTTAVPDTTATTHSLVRPGSSDDDCGDHGRIAFLTQQVNKLRQEHQEEQSRVKSSWEARIKRQLDENKALQSELTSLKVEAEFSKSLKSQLQELQRENKRLKARRDAQLHNDPAPTATHVSTDGPSTPPAQLASPALRTRRHSSRSNDSGWNMSFGGPRSSKRAKREPASSSQSNRPQTPPTTADVAVEVRNHPCAYCMQKIQTPFNAFPHQPRTCRAINAGTGSLCTNPLDAPRCTAVLLLLASSADSLARLHACAALATGQPRVLTASGPGFLEAAVGSIRTGLQRLLALELSPPALQHAFFLVLAVLPRWSPADLPADLFVPMIQHLLARLSEAAASPTPALDPLDTVILSAIEHLPDGAALHALKFELVFSLLDVAVTADVSWENMGNRPLATLCTKLAANLVDTLSQFEVERRATWTRAGRLVHLFVDGAHQLWTAMPRTGEGVDNAKHAWSWSFARLKFLSILCQAVRHHRLVPTGDVAQVNQELKRLKLLLHHMGSGEAGTLLETSSEAHDLFCLLSEVCDPGIDRN